MTSEKGCRKDKNQNIQVFVRLRPLNQRERDIKSLGVVEVVHNREVVVRQSQQTSLTKKFTFDRAFGPNAKQVEVYQDVVSPLIEEVLAGYNCTVFAYGQTGTGKTHTMVGESVSDETSWQNDPLAGIIPRALSQLFDELRISNTEYTVRVSYLELYNEELFDLLSSSEDNSKLRIYEDVTRKGSNIVNGLEEITVYNKNEVYKIMAQGQERKRVASTLMNAQSSRSHTVFTIVVHMKENSPEGEELVKIGKLNLVDLAGSENISKAGSDNPAKRERARECVNINQSLLTLGRVITALVERHPHIPYRESKLTRILQESLGGRTKTSIIATISPGHKDLEETMSTLEYAHRAKNIQNKPEINQKMTKKAILKEYAEEIDRLKRDLQAARDKNGVYLANETFTEMTLKQEEQRKEIQELLLKKRAMEEERDRMENVFAELNQKLEKRVSELKVTKNKLTSTRVQLANTNNLLQSARVSCEEQQQLVRAHAGAEAALSAQARALLAAADAASGHVACLHDTVDKRRSVESINLEVTKAFREQSSQHRDYISSGARQFAGTLADALNGLQNALEGYTATTTLTQEENKAKLEELVQITVEAMNKIKSITSQSHSELTQSTDVHRAQLSSAMDSHNSAVQSALSSFLQSVTACVQHAHAVDVKGNIGRFVDQWYAGAAARVTSLSRAHASFDMRALNTETNRLEAAKKHRESRRARAERRTNKIQACIAEIEEEKAQIDQRLAKQITDIETERKETETRLQEWIEEERRLLEERISRHVATEKSALEHRLNKKLQEIEEEKKLAEERIARQIQWQQLQLEANEEEIKMAERDLEETESGKEDCIKNVKKYGKEFEEGASAISTDMEVFSRNVVQVADHLTHQLLRALMQAKETIQTEVASVMSCSETTRKQLTEDTDSALSGLVMSNKQVLDTVIQNIETNNTSTIQTLTHLESTTSSVICSSRSHAHSHASVVQELGRQVSMFERHLTDALQRHAELERQYLMQEYKVYSPTGKTPSRVEYRYPRVLTATSPHDRIIARFRAMRQQNHDDECVVVESDTESRATSDCESSVSDDSAVFAAPSPPAPPHAHANTHANTHAHPIVKCTSETDIYAIKRQQDHGKENANRSITCKKPSKLPAPASHKKPLVERNGTVN